MYLSELERALMKLLNDPGYKNTDYRAVYEDRSTALELIQKGLAELQQERLKAEEERNVLNKLENKSYTIKGNK